MLTRILQLQKMFLSSSGLTGRATSFVNDVATAVTKKDSKSINKLLSTCPLSKADLVSVTHTQLKSLTVSKLRNLEFIGEYLMFLRSRTVAQNEIGALETLTLCIRKLVASYIGTEEDGDDGDWLFPTVAYMFTLARKFAQRLDKESDSLKWGKKMVEVYREIFPLLFKERNRLNGTCWLVCELLNLYMSLDQVKLCAHILAALSQSLVKEGGFNPESVYKSVAVTLYYYWGKYDVMESRFAEAHKKLAWSFRNCPRDSGNRKRIAEYLIPSMIAVGVFPKDALIDQVGLVHFKGLANAIKAGNVGKYNELMGEHMMLLAKSGTLILMEKCKLICYRNLAKRVAIALKDLTNETAKLELVGFDAAWEAVEGASRDEMICSLADLIYAGAMKGYIAMEHDKVVLSKVNPFPPIDQVMS